MKQLDFDLVTTRGGDTGESFTYDGQKKVKFDIVFETVGDLDELNSFLGIVRNIVEKKTRMANKSNSKWNSSFIITNSNRSIFKII